MTFLQPPLQRTRRAQVPPSKGTRYFVGEEYFVSEDFHASRLAMLSFCSAGTQDCEA